MRITVNSKRAEMSIYRYVDSERWNVQGGYAKGSKAQFKELNNYLDVLRSKVYQAQRDLIADYSKAIEINPYNTQFHISRGCTKDELGDYRGAIADFSKVIKIDPDYSYGNYNRGNAKQKLGDINGACLDWNKAVELGHKGANEMIKKYCKY